MFHNSHLIISIKTDNLLTFLGGCVGAFSHFLSAYASIMLVNFPELLDFALRSTIGGVLAVVAKAVGEWLVAKIKSHFNKKQDSEGGKPNG